MLDGPMVLRTVLVILLGAWSYLWKVIALWMAARRGQLGWYVALCLLNTLAILELIYIFGIAPRHPELHEARAGAA